MANQLVRTEISIFTSLNNNILHKSSLNHKTTKIYLAITIKRKKSKTEKYRGLKLHQYRNWMNKMLKNNFH